MIHFREIGGFCMFYFLIFLCVFVLALGVATMKRKIVNCKTCGCKIAVSADICPYCGAKSTSKIIGEIAQGTVNGIVLLPFFILFVVIVSVFWALSPTSDTAYETYEYDAPMYDEYETSIPNALITLQEFESLQTGMSYERCVQIINGYGHKISETSIGNTTTVSYRWEGYGSPGASASLIFSNNQLYSKVQYGLR